MMPHLFRRMAAYIRLLHIKQLRGFPTPPLSDEQTHCRNCGNDFTGNYCNRCGQSRQTPRFTLRTGVQNMLAGLTNIGNGFGRTLIELLLRPGYMIADFIGGRRVRYFRPFQTLFVLAAVYILLTQLVLPPEKKEREFTAEQLARWDSINRYRDEDGAFWRIVRSAEKGQEKLKQQEMPFVRRVGRIMSNWAHGNKAVVILMTIPFLTVATRVVFRRRTKRQLNLTEHLFAQVYIASQLVLLSMLYIPFGAAIDGDSLYGIPWWIIALFYVWDYRQLFGNSWPSTLWLSLKMFALFVLLATVTVAAGLGVVLGTMVWMGK